MGPATLREHLRPNSPPELRAPVRQVSFDFGSQESQESLDLGSNDHIRSPNRDTRSESMKSPLGSVNSPLGRVKSSSHDNGKFPTLGSSTKSPFEASGKSLDLGKVKTPLLDHVKSPSVVNAKSPFASSVKSLDLGNPKSPFQSSANSPVLGSPKSPCVENKVESLPTDTYSIDNLDSQLLNQAAAEFSQGNIKERYI